MSQSQHGRRDFLRGKAAVSALQETIAGTLKFPEAEISPQNYLINLSRRAMACDFEIQFPADSEDYATEHALDAFDLIEQLEAQMTVYRDDSEVIRINQTAAEQPVEVEPRLFEVLQLAEKLYRDTKGAFDITSGPLSQVWGFSRREGRLPAKQEVDAALDCVGFDNVRLDHKARTIEFLKPNVEINLNSIGKGYALDRAKELLEENGVVEFLLHGGRSSVQAWGRPQEGWKIGLRHPLDPEQQLAEFTLRNQALATSGSGTQFFEHEGKRYGHLLDPCTGWPVEGVISATVTARTSTEADAYSTAFYLMGSEKAAKYCIEHPSLQAILVCPGKHDGEIEVHKFNLE